MPFYSDLSGVTGDFAVNGNFDPIGGISLRVIELSIASTPKTSGSFVVTTTGLTVGRQVLVTQATGTGLNADDIEWDGIIANGIATSSTQFTCYWSAPQPVSGIKRFNYLQV